MHLHKSLQSGEAITEAQWNCHKLLVRTLRTHICVSGGCSHWSTACLSLINIVYCFVALFPDNQVMHGKNDSALHVRASWMIEMKFLRSWSPADNSHYFNPTVNVNRVFVISFNYSKSVLVYWVLLLRSPNSATIPMCDNLPSKAGMCVRSSTLLE